MSPKTYARASTALAVAGTAFSGYLSVTRMTRGICAFDESCPFFLGHPACYYGFALFASLLVVSVAALVTRTSSSWPAIANLVLATAGVVFASSMTGIDLASGGRHPMLLPTCAWGLVFFIAVLALSLAAIVRSTASSLAPRRLP